MDKEQNVIVAGKFTDTLFLDRWGVAPYIVSVRGQDGFIAKYDKDGGYLWSKHIEGAIGNDDVTSIAIDEQGSVYATGGFRQQVSVAGSSLAVSSASISAYVLKISDRGEALWMKAFHTTGLIYSREIVGGRNGDFYLAGRFGNTGAMTYTVDFDMNDGPADTFFINNSGHYDAFVARYDSAGNFIWAKSFGGKKQDDGFSVAVDAEGNAYLGGSFQDTAFFGMDTVISSSYLDSTNFAGMWFVSTKFTGEMFIVKIDSLGNLMWHRQFRQLMLTSGIARGIYSLAAHPTIGNGIYVGGGFEATLDFDPGAGSSILVPEAKGSDQPFVLKLDAEGKYEWVKTFAGNFGMLGTLTVDRKGSIFSIGYFRGTTDFDPGAGNVSLTSQGGTNDAYIHKMVCADTNSASVSYTMPCTGLVLNGDTFMVSGTYVQNLTNHFGCDSILTIHLTVEIPEAIINVDEFVLSTTMKFETYQWLLDGVLLEGETDSVLHVKENGNYQVIVTDKNGCSDTSEIYVVDNVSIDPVISLQGQVRVYPNPASDLLKVYSPVPVDLYLSSVEGRILMKKTNAHILNLDGLADGVYLLSIKDKNGQLIKTEKVIKQ